MHIRVLNENDFQSWKVLWSSYLEFYHSTMSDESTEITYSRLLSDEHPMYCLLYEHDGEPVGLVHFIMHRSTWTTGDYCYLQDLYVSKSFRGNGAGKALINAVYNQAKDAGCSRVYWTTQENNYQARKLYDVMANKTDFIQYKHLIS